MGKSSDGNYILAPEVTKGTASSWRGIANDPPNIRELSSCIIVLSVVIHIYYISKHNIQ